MDYKELSEAEMSEIIENKKQAAGYIERNNKFVAAESINGLFSRHSIEETKGQAISKLEKWSEQIESGLFVYVIETSDAIKRVVTLPAVIEVYLQENDNDGYIIDAKGRIIAINKIVAIQEH